MEEMAEIQCVQKKPRKNVLAGIRIRKGAKLGDDNTILCDGSHICICFDKPT